MVFVPWMQPNIRCSIAEWTDTGFRGTHREVPFPLIVPVFAGVGPAALSTMRLAGVAAGLCSK